MTSIPAAASELLTRGELVQDVDFLACLRVQLHSFDKLSGLQALQDFGHPWMRQVGVEANVADPYPCCPCRLDVLVHQALVTIQSLYPVSRGSVRSMHRWSDAATIYSHVTQHPDRSHRQQ